MAVVRVVLLLKATAKALKGKMRRRGKDLVRVLIVTAWGAAMSRRSLVSMASHLTQCWVQHPLPRLLRDRPGDLEFAETVAEH
jgi:hypothetical protein